MDFYRARAFDTKKCSIGLCELLSIEKKRKERPQKRVNRARLQQQYILVAAIDGNALTEVEWRRIPSLRVRQNPPFTGKENKQTKPNQTKRKNSSYAVAPSSQIRSESHGRRRCYDRNTKGATDKNSKSRKAPQRNKIRDTCDSMQTMDGTSRGGGSLLSSTAAFQRQPGGYS